MNPTCTKSVTGVPTQGVWPPNTQHPASYTVRYTCEESYKQRKAKKPHTSISWQCRGSVGTKRKKTYLGNRKMSR